MGRLFKSGLDYFPLDTKMDDEIELIESEHGIKGFGVLVKLYQKIYAYGYWINWDKKEEIMFSNRINVDRNEINDIINSCIEWNIFDKKVFEKYKVLTSRGIQKRYFQIIKRREKIDIVNEYLLVDYNEYLDKDKIDVNINLIDVNVNSQSKVKESKEDNNIYSKAFEKWWLTYPKRNGRRAGKAKSYRLFKKIKKDDWGDLKKSTENYSKESGKYPKDPERFLKDDFWKEFINEIEPEKRSEFMKSIMEKYA